MLSIMLLRCGGVILGCVIISMNVNTGGPIRRNAPLTSTDTIGIMYGHSRKLGRRQQKRQDSYYLAI